MRWSLLLLAVLVLAVGAGCGRTALVHLPVDASIVIEDAGFDAGVDAGDAGFDAGVFDAGPPCVILNSFTLVPAGHRPIDVLLVVDNSCSMADDQTALARNFDVFFNAFTANQVDFHLGVITTDMENDEGRLTRCGWSPTFDCRYLTSTTPDLRTRFDGMVRQGSGGSSDERALEALSTAIHEPLKSGFNAGFLRSDADLTVVFLGDEDDHSDVDYLALSNYIQGLKTDPSAITVAAIIGLGACWPPRSTLSGWRIAKFTRTFGTRAVMATCTQDYSNVLTTISGRVVNARCQFGLTAPLDLTRPLRVTVNGQPTQWSYEHPDSQFPFGSLEITPCPQGGGTVVVGYVDQCP